MRNGTGPSVLTAPEGSTPKALISVCVCTFQRPKQLNRLLECLDGQITEGLFNFSIVVVDNDIRESARNVAEFWVEHSKLPIAYGVEPQQNIALARNASLAMATGELLAFVDDDEEPSRDWLRKLYETLIQFCADGVLGPVVPTFDGRAPAWALNGGLFRRPSFKTGEVLSWTAVGIGNALVKREVLLELSGPFRPEFGAGGEDRDLLRRAMLRGRAFVWSAEAVCYEPVPPERTKVVFQIRRALLRGKIASRTSGGAWQGILKSAVAVPLYAIVLPLSLIVGAGVCVTCLVKIFDHLGKLLASCGIDLVGDKYIT